MRRPRPRFRFSSPIRSIGSALLVILLLAGVPLPARAQDASTEAAAAFDQGTQYFGNGQYALALESFRTAYRLRAHPAVLLNIATSLDRLGRAVEAVAEYHRYRRLRGSGIEPERRRFVEDALRRLRPQVTLLFITLPAPGAEVAIDGRLVEIGEDPVVVPPGPHTIESRAPDGRTTGTRMVGVAGQMQNVELRFAGGPPPAPGSAPGPGAPGAVGPPADPGGSDGDRHEDRGRERSSTGWDPSLRWIGLGATAVFGGLMIFTASRTLSLADEYDQTNDSATREEGLTYRAVTEFVFFPATLLAAGFTVLAFVFAADGEQESTTVHAVLSPTPDGFALAALGRF